ncbi:MAG: 1-aminocyclopropane-carboxylate deaminase, partial [Microvirga sp.]|nr:1-aminocyclopropane-carboxylate deaminase [Microvirga sp.]
MERVSSFLAMDVLSAAAAKERRGGSVIHMEVGQPSAPAPRAAREAAKAALDLGRIGYTEALGLSSLRERIAR